MTVAVVSQLSVVGQTTYALTQSSGFGTIQLPANAVAFNLANISLTTWNSLYLASVGPIATATGSDINIYAFTDLFGNATGMRHICGIQVLVNSVGALRLSPGATNPLQWFFHGTSTATDYITINPASASNAGFQWWDDPNTAGSTVGSGNTSLRLANASTTVTPTATILILGSTA